MNFDQLFEEFRNKRILVVGDVMIDAYLKGKVNRISPEAPVPIINLESREERLGGAANVALNIKAMGAKAVLCSVVGEDDGGFLLSRLLEKEGLETAGIIRSGNRKTSVKTRVIGNNQQLLRIDEEEVLYLQKEDEDRLISAVTELLSSGIDALVFEDYNKGVLTERVISELISVANKRNIPSAVDPKFVNFLSYKGVTLFKPNLKELQEGLGRIIALETDKIDFEGAVREMEQRLSNRISFVTLSEHGVFIKQNDEQVYVPAHVRTISDVSGAGDTVIAVAALCLSANISLNYIAEIANLAGGLVCEHRGVVPINRERLLNEAKRTIH
jgi:D-glycero-beta-D-manno-heptose-7-phosphate kinase